jgi:hypothetical protein
VSQIAIIVIIIITSVTSVIIIAYNITVIIIYKMLHWINWIVLLSLDPLAGELKYASVVWSAAGAGAGRVSNV